jgi:hypothetical protein
MNKAFMNISGKDSISGLQASKSYWLNNNLATCDNNSNNETSESDWYRAMYSHTMENNKISRTWGRTRSAELVHLDNICGRCVKPDYISNNGSNLNSTTYKFDGQICMR